MKPIWAFWATRGAPVPAAVRQWVVRVGRTPAVLEPDAAPARCRLLPATRDAQIEAMRRLIGSLRRERRDGRPAEPYATTFWAHRGSESVRVAVDSLLWIEAERDYVRLHQREGSCLLHGSISGVAARLDPAVFVRLHRSAIVRASEVSAVSRGPTGVLVVRLASGHEVPVGRSYARNIAALQALLGRLL